MHVKEINDKLIACKNYYNAARYKNLNVSLDYEINKIIPIKRFNFIRECYQFYLTVPICNEETPPQLLRIELLWTDRFYLRSIRIPEQTIKIDDWTIRRFPDLYPFQNTVVDDNFDVTYFLDILESIYSEFESRQILNLKNNLLNSQIILTAKQSSSFSSMLKEKIKWMKEDFFRTPHNPACGKAEIIIEYLNLYTDEKKYKHMYFRY